MASKDDSLLIRGSDGKLYYIRGEQLAQYEVSDADAQQIAANVDVSGGDLKVLEHPGATPGAAASGHFTAGHFTASHFTAAHFTASHFSAAHFTAGHFTDADFTEGHFTTFVNVGRS